MFRQKFGHFIVTAIDTGMPKSELLNLKWSDIDFDQLVVVIQAKKDWHTKNYRIRTLQLTPDLYNALKEHKKLQTELGVKCEYVFTYKGVPGYPASLSECLQEMNYMGEAQRLKHFLEELAHRAKKLVEDNLANEMPGRRRA